jgi:hypothetical protein
VLPFKYLDNAYISTKFDKKIDQKIISGFAAIQVYKAGYNLTKQYLLPRPPSEDRGWEDTSN